MEDYYLTQVVEELTRGDVLLELVLTNKGELVGNVKSALSFGCNDPEIVKFGILHGRNRTIRFATPYFRKANSDLFKDLLGDIPMCKSTEYGGPRELVDIQEPLLSSRLVDP